MRNDSDTSSIRPDHAQLLVTGQSAATDARSRRLRHLFARCLRAGGLRAIRPVLSSAVLIIFVGPVLLFSQTIKQRSHDVKNGERIYKSGCITCHGAGGVGAPETLTEFRRPDTFPDFSRCDQTTPEPNSAWKDVVLHGGPSRAFSQVMPAFDELLSSDEIDDVIAYMRSLCRNAHWARGELNLPRALITEKAFPEDELVISTAVNASGAPGFTTDIIHEQRFGMRNQLEVDVPLQFQDQAHTWYGGVGDTTVGLKRVMWSSLRSGSILSLFGGVIVPSGNRARGFGTGMCSSRLAPIYRAIPTLHRSWFTGALR